MKNGLSNCSRKWLAAGLLLIFCHLIFGQQIFKKRGAGGGSGIFHLVYDPHLSGHLLLIGDVGGMYESFNGGTTWQNVIMPFSFGCHQLSNPQFAATPGHLFVNAGNTITSVGYLFEFKNDGFGWQKISPDSLPSITFLEVDPLSDSRLLIGCDDGKLRLSNDGGHSFQTTNLDSTRFIGGAAWAGQRVFILTETGLFSSTDGGLNFSEMAMPGFTDEWGGFCLEYSTDPLTDELHLFATVTPGKTELGDGNSWPNYDQAANFFHAKLLVDGSLLAQNGNGKLFTGHPFSLACARNDVQTIYATGADGSKRPMVQKTIDGGLSWSHALKWVNNENVQTAVMGSGGDYAWHWSEFNFSIGVHPFDASKVMVGDFSFIHGSENGGGSWSAFHALPAHRQPAGQQTLQGQFFESNGLMNNGATDIHFVFGQRMLVGYMDFCMQRSEDAGLTFRQSRAEFSPIPPGAQGWNTAYRFVRHPQTGVIYAVLSTVHDIYQTPVMGQNGHIDGGKGAIFQSLDNGLTWQMLHFFDHTAVHIELDPANPERLYVAIAHSDPTIGGIWRTDNLSAGPAANFYKMAAPIGANGHAYAVRVLPDGAVLATFSVRKQPVVNGVSGDFESTSGVFYLPPGGSEWGNRSIPAFQFYTKDLVVDSHDKFGNTIYVTVWAGWGNSFDTPEKRLFSGVYKSTDRGLTWQKAANLYRPESVTVSPLSASMVFITTEGEGLWKLENGLLSRIDSYPHPHPYRLFFNPSNPCEVWVSSYGNGLSVANLEDLTGQPCAVLSSKAEGEPVEMTIFPNPTAGVFTLSSAEKGVENRMRVFRFDGQPVLETRFFEQTTIDLSPFGKGVYLLEGQSGGRPFFRKVVCQ